MREFFVDKETDTPADTCLAFGLAELLDRLLDEMESKSEIIIEDRGDCYQILLEEPLEHKSIAGVEFFSILNALDTRTKQAELPEAYRIDYLQHQRDNQAFFEAKENELGEEELAAQGLTPPDPDWPVWAVINQMFATSTYNGLAEQWYEHQDCFPKLVEIILELYATRPNPVAKAEKTWKKLAKKHKIAGSYNTAQLQVVNPGMGKGFNRSKADRLPSASGLKGFWIPEYLKYVGFYQAALPRSVRGNSDRKTYVLRPNRLSWRTHKRVFPQFKAALFAQTAVKMDILATLNYCRVFIGQWLEGQVDESLPVGGNPGDHVAAVEIIYYKYLGSAHATMNVSALALPLWLGRGKLTQEQATVFLHLLEEHQRVVQWLDEGRSDQNKLLRSYRDFLSGEDLRPFFSFCRSYANHIMSQLAKGNPVSQFTTTNQEVLVMAHDDLKLAPIVQNEGFRNIAEAIRRSTVLPQRQKANNRNPLYEIRYGLGDKLLRHAQYRDKFVQALSRFMHDYNRENVRKYETRQQQQYRRDLKTEDIEAVVKLIDEYDAPTIANLLVAFGYARDPSLGRKFESDEDDDGINVET